MSATDLPAALDRLQAVLDGKASLIPLEKPHPSPNIPALMRAGEPVDPGLLIASTSGSTGTPKGAMLTRDNLLASIEATEAFAQQNFQAKPGPWLLALPAHHIAGLQVLLRSLHAGFTPLASKNLLNGSSFSASGFMHDAQTLRDTYPKEDLYVSLVPTQLERILADERGSSALGIFSMVLVGGAAARDSAVEQARAAGVNIVTTYGSSETSGGAVYNNRALPGVHLSIDSPDAKGIGNVVISGPMVSPGYRNIASGRTFPTPGTFITSDLGSLDEEGNLSLLGRADGAINTGGYKVLPEEVEQVLLTTFPQVTMACVTRVEDNQFGETVGAALEWPQQVAAAHPSEVGHTTRGRAFTDISSLVRDTMRGSVPKHLIPIHTVAVETISTTGPGKVDRLAVEQTLNAIASQKH